MLILRLPTNAVLLGALLCTYPHVMIIVDVPKAVMDDAVDYSTMAKPETHPRLREVVRGVGHALEATGHHGPSVTERDALGSEHHRFHARGTHLHQWQTDEC